MGQPTEKDILDYMCFLSQTAKAPANKVAKLLGICPKWLAKRADRGALWVDHFLANQNRRIQEMTECEIKDFSIENVSESQSIFFVD